VGRDRNEVQLPSPTLLYTSLAGSTNLVKQGGPTSQADSDRGDEEVDDASTTDLAGVNAAELETELRDLLLLL